MSEPTVHYHANGEPGWITVPGGLILDGIPYDVTVEYEGTRDNGGETFDRYSAGFQCSTGEEDENPDRYALLIGETGNHPQGVCMHAETGIGEDDGEEVSWTDLPVPVQRAIIGELASTPYFLGIGK